MEDTTHAQPIKVKMTGVFCILTVLVNIVRILFTLISRVFSSVLLLEMDLGSFCVDQKFWNWKFWSISGIKTGSACVTWRTANSNNTTGVQSTWVIKVLAFFDMMIDRVDFTSLHCNFLLFGFRFYNTLQFKCFSFSLSSLYKIFCFVLVCCLETWLKLVLFQQYVASAWCLKQRKIKLLTQVSLVCKVFALRWT